MMWNTRKHDRDRDSGGPVLRDPLASRTRAQPYGFNSKSHFQSNNANFNRPDNFDNFGLKRKIGPTGPTVFPPTHNDAPFPQIPDARLLQEAPTTPLLPLLGFQTGMALPMNAVRQEPVMQFPGSVALPPFNSNQGSNSFNFQPPMAPTITERSFQNQGTYSHSHNFDGNTDVFGGHQEQQQTLNLQPQWSVSNNQNQSRVFNDQVPRSMLHDNVPQGNHNTIRQPPTFYQSSHHQSRAQTINLQPSVSKVSDYKSDKPYNENPRPTSLQNTFKGQSTSLKSQSQQPIPSLLSINPGFNNSGSYKKPNEKYKGKNFNQRFQAKNNVPSGVSSDSSSTRNENIITITPTKPKSGPLLPTPKLIPYPPPPLNPRSSNENSVEVSQTPRGILKNSSTGSYGNFVRASTTCSSNEDSPSAVVPYTVGDDDDEDNDIEFMTEVQNSDSSASNMTHDFFSEKMVQHFASILNERPIEEQLEELLKYLVLPTDFLATRVSIVRNLHVMLRDTFKNCVLQPYGADFIGVGNSDDSVNIFVDLTGKQGPSPQIDSRAIEPLEVTKETLEELLNLIQEDKNHKFFGQIVRRTNFSNARANLPIISFIHSETKVRCNIRLDNYLLVQEAKMIQFICSLDGRIPSLLALARYWSSVHKVLDTPEEDTKNRFVSLLVLFFLAYKKIIPTMAHLQSLCVNHEYFNNLDIGFCDDYSLVPQNENPALEDKTVFTLSILSLLKEFFKMFANAKLKEEVVSMWKAEFIPKENFSPELEGKVLPPDLRKRYRYGANGKLRNKRLDCDSRLCIQDFQDLSENLTIAVAEYDISKFQAECDNALKKLESIMSCGTGNLMDLFVVSEYASYGTQEHRDIHKLVYLLFSIDEDRCKKTDSQKDPVVSSVAE